MRLRLTRSVALLCLAVLLVTAPVFAGCGGGDGDAANRVTIGYLGDFTGAASLPCQDLYKGLTDYFAMVEEDDPIPGVTLKMIHYDTRMDYSRAPGAFEWLRGQGSDIFFDFSPIFSQILADKHEQAEIPAFSLVTTPDLMQREWFTSYSVDYPSEAEVAIYWIVDEWWDYDEMGRPPVVGHMGCSGYESSTQIRDKLEEVHSADPTKFELKQTFAPAGTTTWATELIQMIDCDIMLVNLLGPQPASLLREATNRGYEGTFLGTSLCFGGSWELIKSAAAQLSDLDGALLMHAHPIFTDDIPFTDLVEANLERYRSDEDTDRLAWTYFNAQEMAMILVDIIRRAALEVGPDNVDAAALYDAAQSIDMTLEGWGEPLKYHNGLNVLHRTLRVIEYRVDGDQGDWYGVTDWIMPPSLE